MKDARLTTLLKSSFGTEIIGLDWNAALNTILLAWNALDSIALQLYHRADGKFSEKKTVVTKQKPKSIALFDDGDQVLLVFENTSLVYSWKNKTVIHRLERAKGFLAGGFLRNGVAWITLPAPSGCVDWSQWEYTQEKYRQYELERFDHYGRGVTIHPAKQIIGACWNAYGCGFLLHLAEPENNRLKFFDLGEEHELRRPEYEASAPAFNVYGDHFAFVANPYLGNQQNFEKLCVYNLNDVQKPVYELQMENNSGWEWIISTFFIGVENRYIVLHTNHAVRLVDLHQKEGTEKLAHSIHCITANGARGEFVFADRHGLHLYSINTVPPGTADLVRESEKISADYIAKNILCLAVAGDEEPQIYARTDYRHEIPMVYVKFGYENAQYRLDTGQTVEENLLEGSELKAAVELWLAGNRDAEMAKWHEENGHKKRVTLYDAQQLPIEIFMNKRASENMPNFRMYYEHRSYMVRLEDIDKEIMEVPYEIRELVSDWANKHLDEITADWKHENTPESPKGFWARVRKWWKKGS